MTLTALSAFLQANQPPRQNSVAIENFNINRGVEIDLPDTSQLWSCWALTDVAWDGRLQVRDMLSAADCEGRA